MRKLRVIEFLSLDGVLQSPGAADEDTEGGFRHQGGWQRPYFDDVLAESAAEGWKQPMRTSSGGKTYEKMAAFWPNAPADDPYGQHLNGTRKYIASRTLDSVDWKHSELVQGDVADEVGKLKAQPGGNIAVLGSGELVQTLMAHHLVDEYYLVMFPIVLGSGKRLFRDSEDALKLRLVDSKTTSTGGLILTYRPAD